jgi:hypothetical protein
MGGGVVATTEAEQTVSIESFLLSLDSVRPLVTAPEVAAAWQLPSALADLTVGALTAHLVSSSATIGSFLDRPVPNDADIVDAISYYSPEPFPASLRETLNASQADAARPGPMAVLARHDEIRNYLHSRLPSESPDRLMRVPSRNSPTGEGPGGRYMRLKDYLLVRLVEIVVHSDDLAASVSLPTPLFSEKNNDAVISLFVEMCRHRHGDAEVLRAFTRRERDVVQALRVF